MHRMGRVWILLPCYNEEKALPGVLEQLANYARTLDVSRWPLPLHVIVVDDGSTDRTWQLANEAVIAYLAKGLAIQPIRHENNQGLGVTMRTGIGAFVKQASKEDVLVAMDADGSHPPSTIALMLEAVSRNLDIVIASRFAKGGQAIGVHRARAFYSKLCSSVYRSLFRIKGVQDYSSGFRLYRFSTLSRAGRLYGDRLITERSFACQAELLLKLARLSAICAEVPLVLRYDLKPGPSKMRLGRTVWRYCWLALRESVRRTPVPKESVIDNR
jgi:dolichol-phosphate mannosyltransferase